MRARFQFWQERSCRSFVALFAEFDSDLLFPEAAKGGPKFEMLMAM